MDTGHTVLFVYGTLKRGGWNHFRLAGQEFLGAATTAPRYRVYDLGAHPGMVRDEDNGLAVRGELFAVTDRCLADLDEFEEVPGPFVRAPVEVPGAGAVWAYYLNAPVPPGVPGGDRWPMG